MNWYRVAVFPGNSYWLTLHSPDKRSVSRAQANCIVPIIFNWWYLRLRSLFLNSCLMIDSRISMKLWVAIDVSEQVINSKNQNNTIYSYFEKGCRKKCTRQSCVGDFKCTVFQRNLKESYGRPLIYVCECWRKVRKVGSTATVVRNSVLIISHITFRDCRVHFILDKLSRNSCIQRSTRVMSSPSILKVLNK